MNKPLQYLLCAAATTSLAFCPALHAQVTVANDNASDGAYTSGWAHGSNGGSGFGAWQLSPTSNTGTSGFFKGSSTGNGGSNFHINTDGGNSWGMYANTGAGANAIRTFNAALQVGDRFRFEMDNGGIDSGNTVGMGLRNTSGTDRLEFYFVGGRANYTIRDNSGERDTGVPFTREGLRVDVTLTSANTYSLDILPRTGGTVNFTGTFLDSGSIDRLRFFNANAGSGSNNDLFFNTLNITAVPEPGATAALAAAGLGLFAFIRKSRRFSSNSRN